MALRSSTWSSCVEPQLHDLKGHLSLPALRKEAPYTGGYGASKIQLLTGSDGEEGTLHFGASIALWGLDTRLTLLAPSQQRPQVSMFINFVLSSWLRIAASSLSRRVDR